MLGIGGGSGLSNKRPKFVPPTKHNNTLNRLETKNAKERRKVDNINSTSTNFAIDNNSNMTRNAHQEKWRPYQFSKTTKQSNHGRGPRTPTHNSTTSSINNNFKGDLTPTLVGDVERMFGDNYTNDDIMEFTDEDEEKEEEDDTNHSLSGGKSEGKASSSLISVRDLDEQYRDFFKFAHFNIMQSMCFKDLYHTDENIVISAPTGCGKTVCLELAMLKQLRDNTLSGVVNKMVYVAPIRALCDERYNDWKQKFKNANVMKVTGDSTLEDLKRVNSADIIITTPEKWDSMTRQWKENSKIAKSVSLLLIDEVHLVGDMSRGHVLEVIATRMKTIARDGAQRLRIVAVSATIPNAEDVAVWLKGEGKPFAKTHIIPAEFRPVPLTL
eukprot:m.21836 g.21836  ORF g.21836 m.21836 type:complete len:384 (+) comp8763_c0_seq1:81-1232(+)